MEWLVAIYLAVGVIKTINRFGRSAAEKPVWMSTESDPLKLALFFTGHVLLWPLARRS